MITATAINSDKNQTKSNQNKLFKIFEYGRQIRSISKKLLSLSEKMILWELSDRFGTNGRIYPCNKKIELATGLEPKTVLNNLSSLKRKKFIYYPKQHNSNRRYISLYDPVEASLYDPKKHPVLPSLLVPALSLVRDTTIPDEGYPYIRTDQENVPTTPKPPSDFQAVPQPKNTPDIFVVVPSFDDLKNRVNEKLRYDFKPVTHRKLISHGLTDGQIKTLIDEINASKTAKGFGWLIARLKGTDPKSIPDFDEIEKKRLAKEAEAKQILLEREKTVREKTDEVAKVNANIMNKYIEQYKSLPDDRKNVIFTKILFKTFDPQRREQIKTAGINGICEVDNISYRLKTAMGHIRT